MAFLIVSLIMAVAACVLGLRFIFAGGSVLREWGLEVTQSALFMCRRYGLLYLGLGVLFLLGRNAAPSELRSAVCLGIGGASALLGGHGFLEFRAGRANRRIVGPAIIEVVLAVALIWAGVGTR